MHRAGVKRRLRLLLQIWKWERLSCIDMAETVCFTRAGKSPKARSGSSGVIFASSDEKVKALNEK
jgi:hypothetical protein